MKMVTAFAPASVANLNCGFDVLGLAIEAPGDNVSVSFNDTGLSRIVEITGDEGRLPYEVAANTAGKAILDMCRHLGEKRGIDIRIHKNMPFGSGLGSSAASAVAAVVALNGLLGSPLSKMELLPFAMAGEAVASGALHADNVGPSLLGGIVLISGYQPLDVNVLPAPDDLYISVVKPDVEILTQEARNILPKEVSMKAAIKQSGNLAGLVRGLYESDYAAIGRSMIDVLAEPYRAPLIPHFDEMRDLAFKAGVTSFGISGSGPTVFAFSKGEEKASLMLESLREYLLAQGISSIQFVSKVNTKGAVLC